MAMELRGFCVVGDYGKRRDTLAVSLFSFGWVNFSSPHSIHLMENVVRPFD